MLSALVLPLRRSLLALLGALSLPLHAQQAPLIIEHGVYGIHLLQRTIGTEEYDVIDDGNTRELKITTKTSDRGMKHTTTTALDYRLNFTPTRLEQHTLTPATATAAAIDSSSLTTITGNKVTVREQDTSRTLTKPAIAFTGFANMPAALQMTMMRYWLHHHHPSQLPLLRASARALPVEIRPVGHDVFTVKGEIVRLTRYTVSNLIFGREILWMNDSERIAAIMTFAGGLPQEEILDEYKSAFDPLFQSGVSQEMLDLAELTHAARPLASGTFAIVGARLIDTRLTTAPASAAIDNAVVIVRNNRIAAAGPASTTPVPAGIRIIHASGQSILPGLWEMHTHYSGVEFGPALLAAGITTARDCGGEFHFLIAVRHAIDQQHQLGPRLLLAGLIDGTSPDAFGLFTAATPGQGMGAVDLYADAHFDQIKVYTQIQPDVLRAITEEAHKRGLTVTGHVPAAVNAFQAIADGMDQINHLQFVTRSMVPGDDTVTGQPTSPNPFTLADLSSDRARSLIALLAAKHIVVDPTLGWTEMAGHPHSIPTATFEPGVNAAPFPLAWRYNNIGTTIDPAKFHERMDASLKVIDALHTAGVPIVAGSDTNLIGYGLDRELELYVQAGQTPLEAIQSATIVPARVMHHDADSGTIEPGKRADLVLVQGDPLTNISALRNVVSVVTDGRLYDSKSLAAPSASTAKATR